MKFARCFCVKGLMGLWEFEQVGLTGPQRWKWVAKVRGTSAVVFSSRREFGRLSDAASDARAHGFEIKEDEWYICRLDAEQSSRVRGTPSELSDVNE